MSTDMEAAGKAAAEARRAVTEIPLPEGSENWPLERSYAFQDAYAAAVAAERGGIAGYKLAVNGAAQMKHFGVDEPVSARIFGDEKYDSGVALPRSGFVSVSVEPELLAVLGDGVKGLSGPVDRAGAIAAIDHFRPAIEVIDQRERPMPGTALPQAVALNVFNAGAVLGEGRIAPEALDLPNLHVTMHFDGKLHAESTGTAPQDPVEAVRWLLNHLAARGIAVEPGTVVLCGTHLPLTMLPDEVRKVEIAFDGIGGAAFSLTD